MSNTIEILRVEVAAEEYALFRSDVQSVQLGARIVATEDEESGLVGVLRTTEGDLPVYRLSDLLGMDADFPFEIQRVLVLQSEFGLWCLLVDRVSQAELISAEDITPLPAMSRTAYVDSVYTKDDGVMLILDIKKLHPQIGPVTIASAEPTDDISDVLAAEIDAVDESAHGGHLLLFKLLGINGNTDKFVVALTPKQVDEVLRSADIHPVPAAPTYLHGVTNWRGQLVPVIDLATRLGLTDERADPVRRDRVVIAHGTGHPIGFYAKSNVDIVTLPAPHTPTEIPEEVDKRLVRGAALYTEGRTVLVPRIGRLA